MPVLDQKQGNLVVFICFRTSVSRSSTVKDFDLLGFFGPLWSDSSVMLLVLALLVRLPPPVSMQMRGSSSAVLS